MSNYGVFALWKDTNCTAGRGNARRGRRLPVLLLHSALGTEALDHIVYAVQDEAFGQFDDGNVDARQAERPVTTGAVEMRVLVIDNVLTLAVLRAYVILHRAAAVIDGMYQSVGK